MLSLDNAMDENEISSFDTQVSRGLEKLGESQTQVEYTVEHKFEGFAVILRY